MKIAVIGCGAYLAHDIEKVLKNVVLYQRLESLSDVNVLKKFDYIINFSLQPIFKQQELDLKDIIDVKIANIIKDSDAKIVMLSSRKVYGTNNELINYSENNELKASDAYSLNKINAEREIQRILPNRCLILRVGNIIDVPMVKNNKTFISWITDSLVKDNLLKVTENKDVAKDFITRDYFQYVLKTLINKNMTGIYNVGSGFESKLGEILPRITGKKRIIFEKNAQINDQFVLNCSRVHKFVKPFKQQELYEKCDIIHKILRKLTTKEKI